MEYLHALAVIAVVIAAGAWRWFDGTDGRLLGFATPTWLRNLAAAVLVACASLLGLGFTPWAFLPAAIAAISITAGYTKWEDPRWQAARFGLPGLLVVVLVFVLRDQLDTANIFVLCYPFLCALAGVSYVYMDEEHARWILGGAVVGGLALL